MVNKKTERTSVQPAASLISNETTYAEGCALIRHYSSVRIKMLSFCLPVCFGLAGVSLNVAQNIVLRSYLVFSEFVIFGLACYASLVFSSLVSNIREKLIGLEQGAGFNLHASITRLIIEKTYKFDIFDKIVLCGGLSLNCLLLVNYVTGVIK